MGKNSLSETSFFGTITAGATHELKNVLAVIKETSGLMGDILAVTESETFQHKEKFNQALSTIQRQIAHGVDILTHLNKFAHGPDKERAEIDLNDVLNELTALCGRFARLKNITLAVMNSENTCKFTTCQISLQMLLFSCLEYCMSHLPQNTEIDIKVEKKIEDGEYIIVFDCGHELLSNETGSNGNSTSNDLEKLQKIANPLNGKLSATSHSIQIILSYQA